MADIVQKLMQIPNFVCFSKVPEDEIVTAEKALGVRFSEEYRKYIAEFGAASFEKHELTGICQAEYLNVVSVTLKERSINPEIPEGYYVIENAGIDGILIWQDRKGTVIESYTNKIWKEVASSLSQYLKL